MEKSEYIASAVVSMSAICRRLNAARPVAAMIHGNDHERSDLIGDSPRRSLVLNLSRQIESFSSPMDSQKVE